MLVKLLTNFFKSRNERVLERLYKKVKQVNKLELVFSKLTDLQIKKKTEEFRYQLYKGKKLEEILPYAYALVREASKRVLNMRHFDVQILGGIVLNQRCIAEMKTGEGKTLTSTLPIYLNALLGKGVHVVTMNDYLANRDAKKNSPLFEFLGMTVGLNLANSSFEEKKNAYLADITYGTNNEYGFDYLRDNMVLEKCKKVQRNLFFSLIDEVDSILIDEARTPLVISGEIEDLWKCHEQINSIIPFLVKQDKEDSESFHGEGDFSVDEKEKQVHLTERGLLKIENLFVQKKLIKNRKLLYSSENISLMYQVNAALKAHYLFTKNIDYIVKNNEIVIVDEHTGRIMAGRRWGEGLHQALESKENLPIQNENQTLASITFQNYFRLYKKISGMTGTALTEAFEFKEIYGLDTIVIPTNKPMIRKDKKDLVYVTEEEKNKAIINDIKKCFFSKQPVLVGTISIEKSEFISKKLNKLNIKHNVLNAKFHEQEAKIISQAGMLQAVTIATNMAGRGTDIVLGGTLDFSFLKKNRYALKRKKDLKKKWKEQNELVISSGGLHIIGTERHDSRRIDNQLKGRSGRQGDPGSSRFYISMEDPLVRIFSSVSILSIMKKIRPSYGMPIKHPWISGAILNAQKKVESRNFDVRKELLEYDDVANEQRKIIYKQRINLINACNINKSIKNIFYDVIHDVILMYFPDSTFFFDKRKIKKFIYYLKKNFNICFSVDFFLLFKKGCKIQFVLKVIFFEIQKIYKKKIKKIGFLNINRLEKSIMLEKLDFFWREHLFSMDYLRKGIHLRGYAQKDPKQEYKRESFFMFSKMIKNLKHDVISSIAKILFS